MLRAAPFKLRAYQLRILDEITSCSNGNVIVMLPTGAGKTAVATETIRRMITAPLNNNSNHHQKKYLILVPTRMLVEQQAKAVREWCSPVEVAEYHGELALPSSSFRVLVATPKAFQIAQAKNPALLDWPVFEHVTFDEVHHVLKDHPYRKLAKRLPPEVGVLGLTASLSYAVADSGIRKSIRELTSELGIGHVATASTQELEASGYLGNRAEAEVIGKEEFVDVLAGVPAAPAPGFQPMPESERKPHLMAPTFWKRIDSRRCTPFTAELVAATKRAEGCMEGCMEGDFESPIAAGAKTRGKMSSWGEFAKKQRSPTEALPTEGGGASLSLPQQAAYWALEQWYEALRIQATSWEENEEGAVIFLKMMFSPSSNLTGVVSGASLGAALFYRREEPASEPPLAGAAGLQGMRRVGSEFLAQFDVPSTYVRLEQLKRQLMIKLGTHGKKTFRGIVFVQQKITVHLVSYYLRQNKETAKLFKCAELYAATTPATPSLAIGKGEAKAALGAFASGGKNLLISTVVAEEGMDVPAANVVFRFDAVLNAVSYLQGRGRARAADSSFVVLSERPDRPASMLHEVEARQLAIAAEFCGGEQEGDGAKRKADEITAQRSRERGAQSTLENAAEQPALGTLNTYEKKTKAIVRESYNEGKGGSVECRMVYETCTRSVSSAGEAGGKKKAKKAAAVDMLRRLLAGEGRK